jgi:hypothetical protein
MKETTLMTLLIGYKYQDDHIFFRSCNIPKEHRCGIRHLIRAGYAKRIDNMYWITKLGEQLLRQNGLIS